MRNIYSSKMNKRAQFFILSAVIIASIIVSLASVKNFATTGDAPKKFYYYIQQLEDEAGAVVDYALYNDPTGDSSTIKKNLNDFLQQSIDKTLEGYPEMEIFACYTNSSNSSKLVCQNNGTKNVSVRVDNSLVSVPLWGSRAPEVILVNSCTGSKCPAKLITYSPFTIIGAKYLNITPSSGIVYTVCLSDSSVQRGQFYFLLKMNTTAGDYVADSGGANKIIC